MSSVARFVRAVFACAGVAAIAYSNLAGAEQFVATPTREVGPYIAGQTAPAPGGGWQTSDDRTLGASINGQGGWQTITFSPRYDEEIAEGVAHSGGHSWRLSNWFHTGLVNPILSPSFGPVSESGTNHVVSEFWFRSVSTQQDPGMFVSSTISDAPGNRMTYFGIFDEIPGQGTGGPTGNGCPDDNGCFHIDAVDVTSGNDAANDGDATFVDHYSQPLQRGVWYRAHIDATFVSGPGGTTTDPTLCPSGATCHTGNDQIHYQVFDSNGVVVFDQTIGSWEAAYYDGRYGNPVGTTVTMTNVAFRVSSNADDGTQQPYDTNSVTNRPQGVYLDDLSIVPDAGTSVKTSFDFDRFVATNGVDNTDCSNANNPCLTLAYAIGQANPYDTIHMAAGRYVERSSATSNLVITKPVAIEGAQVGVDARTRDVNGSNDANETIIVPGVQESGISLSSTNTAVITIASDGVSLDGLVIDGDNPAFNGVNLNGANVDVSAGVFAGGNGIALQNDVFRNFIYTGIDGDSTSGGEGGNVIAHDYFTNITNPSSWGRGIIVEDSFYAQITDNLMDQVRVGIQTNNDYAAAPNNFQPIIARNEIHATRTGIFHNLFYSSATAYTLTNNTIFASANVAQTGQWSGIWVESQQDPETVAITGNSIDGSALAGSGRQRVGYLLNNISGSGVAASSIDGGTVAHVDVGVLSTDATFYTGPVQDFLVQNVAFNDVALGAFYVEDTNEQSGSAKVTIGSGNTFTNVVHQLVLAGANATVGFANGTSGVSDALVRAAGTYYYGTAGSGAPCSSPCTVANASINTAVGAVNASGVVYVEHGTFDETVVIGTGKDGLHLTAADTANPPTITRLTGGPNQPVLAITGTPYNAGAAPKNVRVDHLNIVVDKAHAGEGIFAGGFVDGLVVDSNTITQIATATSGLARYAYTNGIVVNIDGAHNSLGVARTDGSNVTITNNVIAGSSSPNATQFRAGIAVDGSVGTLSGNHSSGLNHDAIVRFATHVQNGSNGWLISGNTFTGGGLEFDAPNAGIAPITIDSNVINSETTAPALLTAALTTPQTSVEADFSAMRLIDNLQNLPVTVSNNMISGYAQGLRGALVENFPNATFTSNTFSPLAGATDFVSLVISNREINTDNPPEAPYAFAFNATRNTFNDSGVSNAGRAVEFIDDNDANGSAGYSTVMFGSTQTSDANNFSAAHAFYFKLIDQTCDTNLNTISPTPGGAGPLCTFLDYNDVNPPGGLPNTHVRPFHGNVYAVNNLFGGVAPRLMNSTQQSSLNQQTFDVNDDPALGLVNYGFSLGIGITLQGPVNNVQVSVPTAYTAEVTNTGNALAENALVQFTISRTSAMSTSDLTLQYYDGTTYQTIPLTTCGSNLCGTFGPQPGGFPIGAGYDQTTQLRVTYNVPDTFTVNAQVQGVTTQNIYATNTLSTVVSQSAAKVAVSFTGPQTATAGATVTGYSSRLTNTGGATTENVVVNYVVSRAGGIDPSNLTLQYFNGTAYQTLALTACGANLCGTFGSPGFAVPVGYDQTTQLQATYAKAGTYNFTVTVQGVTSHTNFASAALQVTSHAAAAANIAANSATTLSGLAGGTASPRPSVIVTDALGNPVTGYAITFTIGANSGSLSGTSQTTDTNGVATVGGWTYGSASTETVTVTTALTGSPITFTATVSSNADIAVNLSSSATYVQYGHALNFTIVVTNAGPSRASPVITDNVPSELDISGATWTCVGHSTGASCTARGTGNLTDTPTIPAAGSVTYTMTASALPTASDETVIDQVTATSTGDPDTSNNTASTTSYIIIYRDSFESGGNGTGGGQSIAVGTLDDVATLTLDPTHAPAAGLMPTTWLRATDAQSREAFRVEVLGGSEGKLVRVVTSDAAGVEKFSAWTPLQSSALGLAGKNGNYEAMFVTEGNSVQMAIPTWAVMPLTVKSAQ